MHRQTVTHTETDGDTFIDSDRLRQIFRQLKTDFQTEGNRYSDPLRQILRQMKTDTKTDGDRHSDTLRQMKTDTQTAKDRYSNS